MTAFSPPRGRGAIPRWGRSSLALRVEVGLVDLLGGGRSGLGAEAALLDHHHDDELRMVGGRPRRVPGVIGAAHAAGLRGAGLAGDSRLESAEARARGSQ